MMMLDSLTFPMPSSWTRRCLVLAYIIEMDGLMPGGTK